MASSMAAITMPRSIAFSRATASAICSSSSRLALTAIVSLLHAGPSGGWRRLAGNDRAAEGPWGCGADRADAFCPDAFRVGALLLDRLAVLGPERCRSGP